MTDCCNESPTPQVPTLHTYVPGEAPFEDSSPSCSTRFHELTRADFSIPVVNGEIDVEVCSSGDYAVGMWVWIPNGGYFRVVSLPDSTHVRLVNMGLEVNSAPGTVVPTGSALIPMANLTFSTQAVESLSDAASVLLPNSIVSSLINDDQIIARHMANDSVGLDALINAGFISALYSDSISGQAAIIPANAVYYGGVSVSVTGALAGDIYIWFGNVVLVDFDNTIRAGFTLGKSASGLGSDSWVALRPGKFNVATQSVNQATVYSMALQRVTAAGAGTFTVGLAYSNSQVGIGFINDASIIGVRIRPQPTQLT